LIANVQAFSKTINITNLEIHSVERFSQISSQFSTEAIQNGVIASLKRQQGRNGVFFSGLQCFATSKKLDNLSNKYFLQDHVLLGHPFAIKYLMHNNLLLIISLIPPPSPLSVTWSMSIPLDVQGHLWFMKGFMELGFSWSSSCASLELNKF
jgi:hypothetical protein